MNEILKIDLYYDSRLKPRRPWRFVREQEAIELRSYLSKSIISGRWPSLNDLKSGSWGIVMRAPEKKYPHVHHLDGFYILINKNNTQFYLLLVMIVFEEKNYNSRFLKPFDLSIIGPWEAFCDYIKFFSNR